MIFERFIFLDFSSGIIVKNTIGTIISENANRCLNPLLIVETIPFPNTGRALYISSYFILLIEIIINPIIINGTHILCSFKIDEKSLIPTISTVTAINVKTIQRGVLG